MPYKNLLFTILILILIKDTSYSHGPSRQKVSESITIDAPSTDVWKIVNNFQNFKWNKNIESVSSDSNKVGSERVLTFNSGENVKQKLEKSDDTKMMVNWRIIETNNSILPVNSYSSKIFVKSKDGKTLVQYKAGFYRGFMGNDPPPELNDENSKKLVKNFITENLQGLKKIVEKK